MTATDSALLSDPARWCALSDRDRRDALVAALFTALEDAPGVAGAEVAVGSVERPYDYTAVVETDVGTVRTPLWSHAQAMMFCDESVHPANRAKFAPGHAVAEAADRLRRRLSVPYSLESRGLTVTMEPEAGVERIWTAERSRFRGRTAVTREDRITNAAADLDLRDLLAHFYSGPALRLVNEAGEAFLLPAAAEAADARLVSLCLNCQRWQEGGTLGCDECSGPVEVVSATRPARR